MNVTINIIHFLFLSNGRESYFSHGTPLSKKKNVCSSYKDAYISILIPKKIKLIHLFDISFYVSGSLHLYCLRPSNFYESSRLIIKMNIIFCLKFSQSH